jgi:hypothetical protein
LLGQGSSRPTHEMKRPAAAKVRAAAAPAGYQGTGAAAQRTLLQPEAPPSPRPPQPKVRKKPAAAGAHVLCSKRARPAESAESAASSASASARAEAPEAGRKAGENATHLKAWVSDVIAAFPPKMSGEKTLAQPGQPGQFVDVFSCAVFALLCAGQAGRQALMH